MEGLAPCSHEEADSRVMVHVADAANKYNSITTRTVDSNVVVHYIKYYLEQIATTASQIEPTIVWCT